MHITGDHCIRIADAFRNIDDGLLSVTKTKNDVYWFSVEKNTDSKDYLKDLIGKYRWSRICRRICPNSQLQLTKESVQKIFIELMNIQKEDLDELSGSIEDRYKRLILFNNFEQFQQTFFNVLAPNIKSFLFDRVKTSGKGFAGLIERITLSAHHHFTLMEKIDPEASTFRDTEMLTSRLADREMQKGAVIHLRDGYFYVDETFVGGEAHCRQTTLEDFRWKKIADEEVDEHLRVGSQLETIRKIIVCIFAIFTLHLVSGRSFTSYYRMAEQKENE